MSLRRVLSTAHVTGKVLRVHHREHDTALLEI